MAFRQVLLSAAVIAGAAASAAPSAESCAAQGLVYDACGSPAGCEATCENPTPFCPAVCVPQCVDPNAQPPCANGYLQDASGACQPFDECQACADDADTEWKACASACPPPSCDNPSPICTLGCMPPACQPVACPEGQVRDETNHCIPQEECPAEPECPAGTESVGIWADCPQGAQCFVPSGCGEGEIQVGEGSGVCCATNCATVRCAAAPGSEVNNVCYSSVVEEGACCPEPTEHLTTGDACWYQDGRECCSGTCVFTSWYDYWYGYGTCASPQ